MKIKYIGAMLNNLEYEMMYKSDFRFKNRFVGNFLTRAISKENFQSDKYNSIMVIGCKSKPKDTYFDEKFLVVEIPFNQHSYDSCKDGLPSVLTDMYLAGIEKANLSHNIPYDFLVSRINDFKLAGYKNEWEFKSKTFRSIGVKALLNCKMTIDYFSLNLMLIQNNVIKLNEEILNTEPSETMFHHEFKDIVLEFGEIKVLNRSGATTYAVRWPLEIKESI